MEDLNGLFQSSSLDEDQRMRQEPKDTNHERNQQIEAEEAFLHGFIVMASNKSFNAYDFITEDHFTDSLLKRVFSECKDFLKQNAPVSFLSLASSFDGDEKKYVMGLASNFFNSSNMQNLSFYLDSHLKANRLESDLQKVHSLIQREKSTATPKILKALDHLKRSISDNTYSPVSQDDSFDDFQDELNKFVMDYDKREDIISTGIQSLDNLIKGFKRGNLIVIGGRPSMGKSALAIMFILNVLRQRKTVLNFSLEMTSNEVTSRILSANSYENGGAAYSDITNKDSCVDQVLDMVAQAQNEKLPLISRYNSKMTVDSIAAEAEKVAQNLLRKGARLDLICIDYLQIIPKATVNNRTEADAISEIVGKIRSLAKHLDVPIILLSQLNRDVEKETNILKKRPDNSHLKQSGAIEQDAHIILFPFRPSWYEKDQKEQDKQFKSDYIEISVSKHRQGATGLVKAFCDMSRNYIGDRNDGDDGLTDFGRHTASGEMTKRGRK